MPAEFDPEECRPDDLELERLWDHDPEFRGLRVEWCKAETAERQVADSVSSTTERSAAAVRVNKARQVLNEYLIRKGLGHLAVWQGKPHP